jgi:hypothetical protein
VALAAVALDVLQPLDGHDVEATLHKQNNGLGLVERLSAFSC